MKHRHSVLLLIAVLLVFSPRLLFADQLHVPRIGVLAPGALDQLLRAALHELGYVEGNNIDLFVARFGDSDTALRSLASDLVAANVDLIVAVGTPAARAAMSATGKIPVIFTSGDPVRAGIANSLARPGRNRTGVSVVLGNELYPKCVEFLHQLRPRARRVGFLGNPNNPLMKGNRAIDAAARSLGWKLMVIPARDSKELDTSLRQMSGKAMDAVIVSGEIFFLDHKQEIAETIRRAALPACFAYREYHEMNVLMSYGPSNHDMMYHVASYVHKVLKGANPSDSPIEQLSKYELIINLRVARALGIKVPEDLLLHADEVIP